MFEKDPKIETKTGREKIFTRGRLNQSLSETLFKPSDDNKPIDELAKDIARKSLTINGIPIEEPLVQLAAEYTKGLNDGVAKMNFELALKNTLKKNDFSEDSINKLLQHYSQKPSYGTTKIKELMQDEGGWIRSNDYIHNLSFKNGSVYSDSSSTGLYIKDPNDSSKHLRDFTGTIKSQFKLTDEGFELVSFSADGDCAPLLDRKLLDKERVVEHINHITDALSKNDLKLFIYHLYTFQKYLDDTLLKIYPRMKPDDIQNWMKERFSQEFKENIIPNEKTFLAIQEMVTGIKYASTGNKTSKKFEDLLRIENAFFTYFEVLERNGIRDDANCYVGDEQYEQYIDTHQLNMEKYIEEAAIKYYAMELSSSDVLKIIEMLYEKEDGEKIKRKFCKYQLENAREIYNTQLEQAVLLEKERIGQTYPAYVASSNKVGGNNSREHDEHNPSRKDLEEIDLNAVRKRLGGTIAYNFLVNIQDTILKTTWNVGTVGGTSVYDLNGNLINKVPKNMVKILAIFEKAYQQDPTGTSEVWIKAFNEVACIGKKAAHKVSLFRDENTQDFYDTFVTAYRNINKSNLPVNEKEDVAVPRYV